MRQLLTERRDTVLSAWVEAAFAAYPPDTANLFRKGKDPFGNPVGTTISQELGALLDGLLEGADRETLKSHLDPVLKIRSVQGFQPSEALSFVFELKGIVREALASDAQSDAGQQAVRELEAEIDRLGMMAFDSYVGFREEIFELRVREAKRSVSWLLRKANIGAEALDPETTPETT